MLRQNCKNLSNSNLLELFFRAEHPTILIGFVLSLKILITHSPLNSWVFIFGRCFSQEGPFFFWCLILPLCLLSFSSFIEVYTRQRKISKVGISRSSPTCCDLGGEKRTKKKKEGKRGRFSFGKTTTKNKIFMQSDQTDCLRVSKGLDLIYILKKEKHRTVLPVAWPYD